MRSAPLISVLLPARDAEATLPCALASLSAQTEPRWECVIVDDGSRDRTAAIAREAARRDGRFRVFCTEPSGIVAALGTGLEQCRAPYVARMDADDLMHRRRLKLQLGVMEAHPELSGVGCHPRLFPRRGLRDGLLAYESWLASLSTPEDVRRERFIECPLAHPTLFLRTAVLRRFGYRDPGWPEDYDLVLRLLAAGEKLGVVPEPLHLWRDAPTRLSRTGAAYRLERFAACRAHYLKEDFLKGEPRYVLWGYGDTGRLLRRLLAEAGHHPSHIVEIHPGRVGQRIAGADVIRPEALPALAPTHIIVSVAGLTARTLIRSSLDAMGFREGESYVCAA